MHRRTRIATGTHLRGRHVRAGHVQQPGHQLRQPRGIAADIVQEPPPIPGRHGLEVILQQFHRAGDPRQRGLELVTDGGGEVAQIAAAPLDPLGHGAEVLIEGADLHRCCPGCRGGLATARRHRTGRGAEPLDGQGNPPGDEARQRHQHRQDQSDRQGDLATILIDSPEKRPR